MMRAIVFHFKLIVVAYIFCSSANRSAHGLTTYVVDAGSDDLMANATLCEYISL